MSIFVQIANFESVSKAAKQMGYVQSHVSKRLEKMEDELGCALFLRTNRGMRLLPKGEVFLKHCHKIMQVMEDIETDFETSTQVIQIGATQSITKNYLHELYLNPNYAIFTRPIPELIALFQQKLLDILLLNRKLDNLDCNCEILFFEKTSWMKSSKSKASIFDKPIVMSRDTQCPYRKLSLLYVAKNEDVQLIEVDSLDTILSMVEQDEAHAILPVQLMQSNLALATLESEKLADVPIYQYMMSGKYKVFTEAIKLAISDHLNKH